MEVRRTWYDSFDGRLRSAGLTLWKETASGRSRLVLTEGTAPVAESEATAEDPSRAGLLSPGPLRQRLAPILEERILLPLAELVSREKVTPVLNGDDKTVARVILEIRRTARPRRQALPATMTVRPLRGYEKDAERITALLGADPRLRACSGGPVEEVLAAVGPPPVPTLDLELQPDFAAGAAVRAVLVRLSDIFEANVDGTVRELDSEFLHDLRVAVRRSRSVLKLVGDVLDEENRSYLAGELKWLGDLTTPTRDLDVYLSDLQAEEGPAAHADLEPFRLLLAERRAGAQARLVRALRSRRTKAILAVWRATGTDPAEGPVARIPVGRLAAERTAKALRRVSRQGRSIGAGSPPEDLHDLRKRGKELRYLLEIFASLHPRDTHRVVVGELKKLQDCLGQYQDSQFQSEGLAHFAAQLMAAGTVPAETILAMGGLAAELERRQAEARVRFGSVFARFDDPANQRRLLGMLEAAQA
ncbi:MAG: CHAD domain-containing protein [Acidimicrobiales bacterium]